MHRQELGCDSEMHFNKLRGHGGKAALAQKWLSYALYGQHVFYWHVLGINTDRLDWDAFGTTKSEQKTAIYTRFVRTALAYSLKHCFGEPVEVTRMYHDNGPLEHHPYFDWHSLWRVQQEHPGIKVRTTAVTFVDSDHRKEPDWPDASNFVQLTDLILGSVRLCLDATSQKPEVSRLANAMAPLLDRIMDPKKRYNPNSRYRHVGRCSVSFFPTEKAISLSDPVAAARSGFYGRRRILHSDGQASLF
jgi:hypothetical protein